MYGNTSTLPAGAKRVHDEFKYRGYSDDSQVVMSSRGELFAEANQDPSQFSEVKGASLFKFEPNDGKGLWIPDTPLNFFPSRGGRVRFNDPTVNVS
jgi:hypothetical protein